MQEEVVAVQSLERPMGRRRCSRSALRLGHQDVVDQGGSEQLRSTLPKNLIACLSRAGSLAEGEVPEALLSPELVRVVLAMGIQERSRRQWEKREVSSKEYSVLVCISGRKRRVPYIDEQ